MSVQLVHAGEVAPRLSIGSAEPPAGFAKAQFETLKFPWDVEDASVQEIESRFFLQRVAARDVEPHDLLRDTPAARGKWLGRDLMLAFFDEAYRVLTPGGKMLVVVPNARHSRAFNDPTHRRFFVAETFLHLNAKYRTAMAATGATCDFEVNVDPLVEANSELSLLHPEALRRRLTESWNVINDWQARLTKLPTP